MNGKIYEPGQGNNAYIFPGVALGVICTGIHHIVDDVSKMFFVWKGTYLFMKISSKIPTFNASYFVAFSSFPYNLVSSIGYFNLGFSCSYHSESNIVCIQYFGSGFYKLLFTIGVHMVSSEHRKYTHSKNQLFRFSCQLPRAWQRLSATPTWPLAAFTLPSPRSGTSPSRLPPRLPRKPTSMDLPRPTQSRPTRRSSFVCSCTTTNTTASAPCRTDILGRKRKPPNFPKCNPFIA